MQIEKERAFLIHLCYTGVILGMLYLFFHSILYEILPFLFGFLIAFSMRPAVRHTIAFFHLPQKFVSFFYLCLFYGTIGTALAYLFIQCFHFLASFIPQLPTLYETSIMPLVTSFFSFIETKCHDLPPAMIAELQQFFTSTNEALHSLMLSISTSLFSLITKIASSLPSILTGFFITVLSSIFFAMDFPMISNFIMAQIPSQKHTHFYQLRKIISDTILTYCSAYGKLMGITFLELSLGLTYLHVDKAISIALAISFFDIFPILGTGTILFPWILISFFHGRTKFAVGLLILHLMINLLRQILEPKIVGKQMGIHPLLMLACMFFGGKLFGFLGILIAPMLLQVLIRLHKEGLLHLYH